MEKSTHPALKTLFDALHAMQKDISGVAKHCQELLQPWEGGRRLTITVQHNKVDTKLVVFENTNEDDIMPTSLDFQNIKDVVKRENVLLWIDENNQHDTMMRKKHETLWVQHVQNLEHAQKPLLETLNKLSKTLPDNIDVVLNIALPGAHHQPLIFHIKTYENDIPIEKSEMDLSGHWNEKALNAWIETWEALTDQGLGTGPTWHILEREKDTNERNTVISNKDGFQAPKADIALMGGLLLFAPKAFHTHLDFHRFSVFQTHPVNTNTYDELDALANELDIWEIPDN